jgi:hypothetical protein
MQRPVLGWLIQRASGASGPGVFLAQTNVSKRIAGRKSLVVTVVEEHPGRRPILLEITGVKSAPAHFMLG